MGESKHFYKSFPAQLKITPAIMQSIFIHTLYIQDGISVFSMVLSRPMIAQLDGDLRSLKIRSELWTFCCVPGQI